MSQTKSVENSKVYKCYLLNVRSHRDYVCLEIDSCPNECNINDDACVDSSLIVMPVIQKIRFNIKSKNQFEKFWFDDKLEIYAEGHQIYPNNYCPNCQNCSENKKLSESSFSSDDATCMKKVNDNNSYKVNNSLDYIETIEDGCFDFKNDVSNDNLIIKDIINKNLKCKSEMLTIDSDNLSDQILTSISLPEYLDGMLVKKDNNEIAIQTSITLGNSEFSSPMSSDENVVGTNEIEQNISPLITNENFNYSNIDDDTKLLNKLKFDRLNNYCVNKRIRYWSLINRARRVIKMNEDAIELNSILKDFNTDHPNLISSLSPVSFLLKLKKINRVSSRIFFNDLSEEKLCNIRYKDKQTCENVFFKSDLSSNKETLFIMQKNMMKMMQTFLNRYDGSTNKTITIK